MLCRLLNLQVTLMPKRCAMVISEMTVRPMDGVVEHPRTDWLRVDEQIPWQTYMSGYQQTLNC